MIKILKYYWRYLFIFISVVFIFIGTYFMFKDNTYNLEVENKLASNKEEKKNTSSKTIYVDVKGAVKNPGVYELSNTSRVIDAINLAGGLSDLADTINLNLSKKLSDEMIIIVYTKTELSTYYKKNNNRNAVCASLECVCIDDYNDACISKESSNKSNSKTDNTTKSTNSKVSINTASKEELMSLSGIGESKAEKIITYRNDNGKFNSIEDLKKVSGIGDSIFEKIKDKIIL
ncbi:MAG: helix-hairpin-helix domain-containing protein [Tenericutes bacterium]|nr:helix-hairpin-helix domain-containing protein [Mycoplasmatota bacterium]